MNRCQILYEPKRDKDGYEDTRVSSYRICQVLADTSNKSLADNTWRSYNTIEGHIRKCDRELGRPITFPSQEKMH